MEHRFLLQSITLDIKLILKCCQKQTKNNNKRKTAISPGCISIPLLNLLTHHLNIICTLNGHQLK